MKIQILGPGCTKCNTTEKNVCEALKHMGIQAEISKITDLGELLEFAKTGEIFWPALIVDGEVKVAGRTPTVEELKEILKNHKGGK